MVQVLDRFAERLAEAAFARRVVWLACGLYAAGFFCFYPNAITNDDEGMYLRQTQMVLRGSSTFPIIDPLAGETIDHNPSLYPIGTAILMAPPVALFGRDGAYLVPLAGLLIAVLLLARWIEESGRNPIFALLLLGYPPTLVITRVAMSDVPAAALVVGGLYCFWRGIEGRWTWSFASGFLAGAGLIFRESNPIPFVPFYLGAVLRRDRNVPALVVGGLLGSSLRLVANGVIHGDAFYQKAKFHLALDLIDDKLPLYLIATLVFIPGGLVLANLYRGKRWPELRAAILMFVGLYLVQKYWTYATSDLKRLIITPRYLIAIVPLFAYGMAESVPRFWAAFVGASESRRRLGRLATATWVSGVLCAAVAVHPSFWLWTSTQGRIQDAINAQLPNDVPLVTNYSATRKFIILDDLEFLPLERYDLQVRDALDVLERYGELTILFLDRTDSPFWRENLAQNEEFLAAIEPQPELVYVERFSPVEQVRMWSVRRPKATGAD